MDQKEEINDDQESELMNREANRRLLDYCKKGDLHNVNLMLANGILVNSRNIRGESAVHVTCLAGKLHVLKSLVEQDGDITGTDKCGEQPIHKACLRGHVAVVGYLISQGADVNITDQDGSQPLHVASKHGHLALVHSLLSKGANIKASNVFSDQPLHLACWEGHAAIVECLIINGADMEAPGRFGERPLHIASERGVVAVVQSLLSNGVQVNSKTARGREPIHWAAEAGHIRVVELLLAQGADLHAAGKDGWQPLHTASNAGELEVVKYLLQQGADVNACTEKGEKAAILALNKHHLLVVDILQSDNILPKKVALRMKDVVPNGHVPTKNGKEFDIHRTPELQRPEAPVEKDQQEMHKLDFQNISHESKTTNTIVSAVPFHCQPLPVAGENRKKTSHVGIQAVLETDQRTSLNGLPLSRHKTTKELDDFKNTSHKNLSMIIEDLHDERRRQDRYLSRLGLKRIEVIPDTNCFFTAAEESARCFLPHYGGPDVDLRRDVVGHLFAWPEKYLKFAKTTNKSILSMIDSLSSGHWPGYECFLALSRVLKTGIRVTYGGSNYYYQPTTDQFYADEGDPERWIHIVWLSAGYYDAVVKKWHCESPKPGMKQPSYKSLRGVCYLEQNPHLVMGIGRRRPCHVPDRGHVRTRSAIRYEKTKDILSTNRDPKDDDKDVCGMCLDDKRRLRINRESIIKDMLVDDVCHKLISEGIVHTKHIQTIQNTYRNDEAKSAALLDLLETRGPEAFNVFKNALSVQYKWLVDLLDCTQL